MRILLSDYSGHPFQVQLSRELARRGHVVRHVSAASFQTPKGRLDAGRDDPDGFSSVPVTTRRPFAKHSFVRRVRQEIEIGRAIGRAIKDFAPDLVISSNAPLDTQAAIRRATTATGAAFVFWVQDLYAEAIGRILGARVGLLGQMVGRVYARREARLLRSADQVVVIAPAFVPAVVAMQVASERITVIPNWAPLDELPPLPRANSWAQAHLAPAPGRLIYSGTLGFKHDPALIAALARALPVRVEVFSQGPAAEALAATALREGLNLEVHGWVPFADLPAVLAAADVLLVILEADAGAFSVPSKVLTYLGAGRAILGSVHRSNLAARLIEENGAGLVVEPGDTAALIEAARRLFQDIAERTQMGKNGRDYAERTFAIGPIADRFENIATNIMRNKDR